jgi:hypothetical protein
MSDDPGANLPRYEILFTAVPLGYRSLPPLPPSEPLVCEQCGAVVADTAVHDQWHAEVRR